MLNSFFLLLTLVYFSVILFFFIGLFFLKSGRNTNQFPVTIIIPARNEAMRISACLDSLQKQTYPAELIQIIVIDDHSTDPTAKTVQSFSEKDNRIQLLSADQLIPGKSPKKMAINKGIEFSQNEFIFTLDADCEVAPDWLAGMMRCFEPQVGVVVGPVSYHHEKNLFQKVQSLEFLGLVTAGAGSIGMKHPIIANGANLAYRKAAFNAVGGFTSFENISSGDDDLLIQKIAQETKWEIRFAANHQAIVHTNPADSLQQFLNQRVRWASKSLIYPTIWLKIVLILIYLFYGSFLLAGPLIYFKLLSSTFFYVGFLSKLLIDFLTIFKGCNLLNRKKLLRYFPLAEILQIPYILYAGASGVFGNFHWKGRKHS
jgi:cellulose synthase/poly-beta-1,6-N-acetylglucosamine synthase-like glycosyltransferase